MTTAEYQANCLTCSSFEYSNSQYESVKTYASKEEAETTSIKSLPGNFSSTEISEKKRHIREINKIVSKWK